jgi:hypothetical protein
LHIPCEIPIAIAYRGVVGSYQYWIRRLKMKGYVECLRKRRSRVVDPKEAPRGYRAVLAPRSYPPRMHPPPNGEAACVKCDLHEKCLRREKPPSVTCMWELRLDQCEVYYKKVRKGERK